MRNILKVRNALAIAALLAVATPFTSFAADKTTQTPIINTSSGTTVVSDSVNNNTAAVKEQLAKAGNQLLIENQLVDSSLFPTPLYQKDNDVMVPLRLVASKLGYEVSWDESTKTATIDGPVANIRIPSEGSQYYRKGKLQNINLDYSTTLATPDNKSGFLYVPASVFGLLFNDVQTFNNSVSIKAQKAYLMNGDTQVATVETSVNRAAGTNSVALTIPSPTPTPAGTTSSM